MIFVLQHERQDAEAVEVERQRAAAAANAAPPTVNTDVVSHENVAATAADSPDREPQASAPLRRKRGLLS